MLVRDVTLDDVQHGEPSDRPTGHQPYRQILPLLFVSQPPDVPAHSDLNEDYPALQPAATTWGNSGKIYQSQQ